MFSLATTVKTVFHALLISLQPIVLFLHFSVYTYIYIFFNFREMSILSNSVCSCYI